MPTKQPAPTGQKPEPNGIDPALVDRLVRALESIAAQGQQAPTAVTSGIDNHDHHGPRPDPVRSRAARDYDVLRGLLGRADAPLPLRMHRKNEGYDTFVVIDDPIPPAARTAIVESPGDGKSGQLTEHIAIPDNGKGELELDEISADMPISRVELVDCHDALVAFGPSLPVFKS
ncbi:MAG TPA: hypothetical protein VH969_31600 [Actinophytocola sp.]|jgi:hypothetical protein|uniref:hypothetical protein n=1 Tax=Actinophytocola sp. TaxID=1872138 RepID=UPI002F9272B5